VKKHREKRRKRQRTRKMMARLRSGGQAAAS
jgi:hypothetical protein